MNPTTSNSYAASNNKRLLPSENSPSKHQRISSQQNHTTEGIDNLVAALNIENNNNNINNLSERVKKLEQSLEGLEKTQQDILSKLSTLVSMTASSARPTNPKPQSSGRLGNPHSNGTQVSSSVNANILPLRESAVSTSLPLNSQITASSARPTNPKPQSSGRLVNPHLNGFQNFSMRVNPLRESAVSTSLPLNFQPNANTSHAQKMVTTTPERLIDVEDTEDLISQMIAKTPTVPFKLIQSPEYFDFLKMVVNATKDLIYDLPSDLRDKLLALNIFELTQEGEKAYLQNNLLLAKWILEQSFNKMLKEKNLIFSIAISYCEILKQLKNFDLLNSCTDSLEKIFSIQIKSIKDTERQSQIKFLLARLLIIKNDYQKAKEILKQCRSGDLTVLFAFCLIKLESFTEAQTLLKTINYRYQSGGSMLSFSLYGEIELRLGNKAQAEEFFLKALQKKPDVNELAFYPEAFIEFARMHKISNFANNQN